MKIFKIMFPLLILFLVSCENEQGENEKRYFWIRVKILKELKYENITINGIDSEKNKILIDEYIKDKGYNKNKKYYFMMQFKRFDVFFLKFSKETRIEDLKDYKIEIKSDNKLIWKGVAYNEDDFSSCGFYQMKDELYLDKITGVLFHFIEKKDNYLKLEGKYYSDLECNHKSDKVMIAINIANNSFNNDLITKINNIDINNSRKNNYIWNNYRDLLESSGLSALYDYSENQDGFGKKSGYWNLMIERDKLKDYKLIFLSKDGVKTVINLNEIQFCGVPEEKSYKELINDFKVLTYAFTLKDGTPKLAFQGALDNNNRMPNCSKESGTTSGIVLPTEDLVRDRYGEIKITNFKGKNYDYSFTNNLQGIYYNGISSDFEEYKKLGFKRWGLGIVSDYNFKDGFGLSIPWHLVKEGEVLKIDSNMINSQTENEKSFWKGLFTPFFYNEEYPVEFAGGHIVLHYGNFQEITYKFNKVPKFYGDFLDMEFHFIAKDGDSVLIDYVATIKSQYFGEDIFQCFNEDKLWICPKDDFEENFPWIENP